MDNLVLAIIKSIGMERVYIQPNFQLHFLQTAMCEQFIEFCWWKTPLLVHHIAAAKLKRNA